MDNVSVGTPINDGTKNNEPHYRCDRCGVKKPPERYREGLPWWHKWCIRCEASPVGQFPIPETDEHRRKL